jgi:hypothetical protein
MKKTISSYEGKQTHIRDLKTPELETFTNIYKGMIIQLILRFQNSQQSAQKPDSRTSELSILATLQMLSA